MNTVKATETVAAYLRTVSNDVLIASTDKLVALSAQLYKAWQDGANVFTYGNGRLKAAAAEASVSLCTDAAVLGREGVKGFCLSEGSACPVAQLKNNGKKGDILIVFASCKKAEKMMDVAAAKGITVVGFLAGDAAELSDKCETVFDFATADLIAIAFQGVMKALIEALTDGFGLETVFLPKNRNFRFALFDFDGTLSLIREGWQKIMIPYFCEELAATPGGKTEDPAEIEKCVTYFVDMLTGKQTIYQCMALADEINKRGGKAEDPMVYKNEYIRRLMEKIHDRREGLRDGSIDPETLLVRGSCGILQALKDEGIALYCASGTDQPQVREEAHLLGMDKYFGENIYGALDEHATSCTKELVIRRLLAENNLEDGSELLSFGDGFVEIELVSNIGGYPIAVATDEARKCGIDCWKRDRLVGAGAGAVVPDFEDPKKIIDFILQR